MDSAKKDVPGQTTVTMRADRGKHSGAPTIGHSDTVTTVSLQGCVWGEGLPDEETGRDLMQREGNAKGTDKSASWTFGKMTWCY